MQGVLKPLIVASCLVIAIAGCAALLVCRNYHVYSVDGLEVYRAMDHECDPAWRDYNFQRIRAGDDVEDVIARTNPTTLERKGRWVVLGYQTSGNFTGITAAAYDGRMVIAFAWSCIWVRVFFDELSEEQSVELLQSSKGNPRRFGIVPVYRS